MDDSEPDESDAPPEFKSEDSGPSWRDAAEAERKRTEQIRLVAIDDRAVRESEHRGQLAARLSELERSLARANDAEFPDTVAISSLRNACTRLREQIEALS